MYDLTVSVCQKSSWTGLGPLFSISQSQNQTVGKDTFLTEGPGEGSISKMIRVAGRIQFLVVVGLKSLFPC